MTKIIIEVEVRPSEDENKVLQAIRNLFDFENLKEEKSGYTKILVAESHTLLSLQKFHRKLREERILDAARKYLTKNLIGNVITFMLNKQAAAVGKISFVDDEKESPLGPIKVTIEYKDPQALIDWLTPKTAKGVPLWENPIPSDE
ncbi:RNA-binding domain-containing protein [Sulfurisphaera tokodaii]|uniref:UPF0201 protein STK_09490 n=2 Tax=Sulfurisphaera tokodaii TaxID=111955 RepID=Y949_SULTO|nr:RNA-binding domain-containing protein [Sulfurisphaera tokodaii]Q973F0.1 RecName: Full=UPF0201 protein STK_09490 [Sulfurisphaera tokodaii str. 7]BAB65963.1 hypothetical protein STK_09490 [Sulfurisphaera tokodaii str. 7]HII73923.1 hypothetical protein [Sulfurisphaera tokodaii]